MKLLLDTHVLLWLADTPERLPADIVNLAEDPETELIFSTVNIWEIAIKYALNRPNFRTDPKLVLTHSRAAGLIELPVLSEHTLELARLPAIHRDPFDRLLVAQAIAEGIELLTADKTIARYPGPVRLV